MRIGRKYTEMVKYVEGVCDQLFHMKLLVNVTASRAPLNVGAELLACHDFGVSSSRHEKLRHSSPCQEGRVLREFRRQHPRLCATALVLAAPTPFPRHSCYMAHPMDPSSTSTHLILSTLKVSLNRESRSQKTPLRGDLRAEAKPLGFQPTSQTVSLSRILPQLSVRPLLPQPQGGAPSSFVPFFPWPFPQARGLLLLLSFLATTPPKYSKDALRSHPPNHHGPPTSVITDTWQGWCSVWHQRSATAFQNWTHIIHGELLQPPVLRKPHICVVLLDSPHLCYWS